MVSVALFELEWEGVRPPFLMRKFLVYAFCRDDGTFYYIGKGTKRRPYSKRLIGIKPPADKNKIIILHQDLDEATAFEYERNLIAFYGRKDKNEGLLRNMTDGGEGVAGWVPDSEWRRKKSESMKGEGNPFYGKHHSQEIIKIISEKSKARAKARRLASIPSALKHHHLPSEAIKLHQKIQAQKRKRGIEPSIGLVKEFNPMFGKQRPDLSQRNREKPFNKNLKWANNGEIELRVLPNEIPHGFKIGRLFSPANAKPVLLLNIQGDEYFYFKNARQAGIFLGKSSKTVRNAAAKNRIINGYLVIR
jgi:hypothetical protein